MEFTINVPFKAIATTSGDQFGYVDMFGDVHVPVSGHGTVSRLKKAFRKQLADRIAEGFRAIENTSKAFIGCKDGTVLCVLFELGSWGYRIAGPERKWASGSTVTGGFKDAIEYAEKHAEQCFGGVAWKV